MNRTWESLPFEPPPRFVPDRLFHSGHAQTVFPIFMRDVLPAYAATPHFVTLDDGDTVVLHDDCPDSWRDGDRITILIHGLGGCHSSTYMVRIANRLCASGIRVFRMDMRGCGAGLHLAKGVFHAGRHEDLLRAVDHIHKLAEHSPITICGFSLGANLTLKFLGECTHQIPDQVDSGVVVEPPIDLHYCCQKMGTGVGWAYDSFFAKMLWRDFVSRRDKISGANRLSISRRPRTLLEFDTHITSQLAGFKDAVDYYEFSSAKDVLPQIRVPVAVLTAADDPIVPLEMFDNADWADLTRFYVSQGGGHLGFIGTSEGQPKSGRSRDHRWMDVTVSNWITSLAPQLPAPRPRQLESSSIKR